MTKVLTRTTEIIYWSMIVLAFLIGFLVYGVFLENFDLGFLVLFSGLPYFLFTIGVFGLTWPKIKPAGDSNYIIHAITLGIYFLVLFFLHIWLILPLVCPDFNPCCGLN